MRNTDIDFLLDTEFIDLTLENCLEKANHINLVEPFVLHTVKDIDSFREQCTNAEEIRIELLRRISEEKFPTRTEAAQAYAMRLLWHALSEDVDKFSDTLNKIKITFEDRFPENLDLARIYASGLYFMLHKKKGSERESVLDVLCRLSEGRFANDSYIQERYTKGLAFVQDASDLKKSELVKEPLIAAMSDAEKNQLGQKIDILLENMMLEDIECDPTASKAFSVLQKLYADNTLHLDYEDDFHQLFDALCCFYEVLSVNRNKIAFISVRSSKGRVFTLRPPDGSYYAIIWDNSYWTLFESFCNTLAFFMSEDRKALQLFTNNGDQSIIESLLADLYTFLGTRYQLSDPSFATWCHATAQKHAQGGNILIKPSQEVGRTCCYLGKMYVLHHELEHIFWDLNMEDDVNSEDYNSVRLLLQKYKEEIEANHSGNHHDYQKAEYLQRLDDLMDGLDNWAHLYMELYFDFKAFYEMATFQEYAQNRNKIVALHDALIGSKVLNMFRTWLYIATHCIEEGLYYHEKGLTGEECAFEINKNIHEGTDEIEFRHVLNHSLSITYLNELRKQGQITNTEFSQLQHCAEPFISAYQNHLRTANLAIQIEYLSNYIDGTRKE